MSRSRGRVGLFAVLTMLVAISLATAGCKKKDEATGADAPAPADATQPAGSGEAAGGTAFSPETAPPKAPR